MLVLFLLSKISRPEGPGKLWNIRLPSPVHLLPNWTFPSGEGCKLSSGDAPAKISYQRQQTLGGQSCWRASMPGVGPCLCASVRDNKVQQPGDRHQHTANSDLTPPRTAIFGKIICLQPSISVSSTWHTLIRITSPDDNADGWLDDCVRRIDCVSLWRMFYLCNPRRCRVNRGDFFSPLF